MGHIYLSHSHPIAIYACPIPSHPMGRFPWDSQRNPSHGQAWIFGPLLKYELTRQWCRQKIFMV